MDWTNVGDINPRSGALLFQDPEIDASGDFRAEAIESICETDVGGDECRFLLRRGTVFLAAKNFASALDTVGAKIEAGVISRPGHHADTEVFDIASPDGLRELFQAAHAYGGIGDVDIESFVQIGKDSPYDQPHKLGTDPLVYPEGTSLWAIMADRLELGEFGPAQGKEPAVPYAEEDAPSP